MEKNSPLERIGRLHQRTYESAGRHMPTERYRAFTGWVIAHAEYTPSFSNRMESAIQWTKQNPEAFGSMVTDFDAALAFLNDSDSPVDEETFPNIVAYRAHRKGDLPQIDGQTPHNAPDILAAARNSANKLTWGETIKPEDGDYYSFHEFVKTDQGMVAASLTDLYENYTRTLDLYPADANVDAIVANAITEAVYLTNPDGELFQTYKNPDDEWIFGYDGFSPKFQELVYGDAILSEQAK